MRSKTVTVDPSASTMTQGSSATGEPEPEIDPRLLNPGGATEQAPDEYVVELDTTKGTIRIEVTRAWAPHGADRFYNLVKIGFFNDVAFFRVVPGFMAQVGLKGEPRVDAAWLRAGVTDDPPTQSNTPGMVTFAKTNAPNSRTTQFFINIVNNARLDSMGFAPFGRTRDMNVVRQLHSGYGDGPPMGQGPMQGLIRSRGNEYLRADFPELDYIRTATIVED
ncbi:MAG: peptidylprolyl isomerase [Myxococcota bacterium]